MKLQYDANSKVAGIGLVPWTRLGPENWLHHYKIASLYGWSVQDPSAPEVLALSERSVLPKMSKLNTANLLQTPEFRSLLLEDLAGYKFITYKPVKVPNTLNQDDFLMVNESFTDTFENKVIFREMFESELRFPRYQVFAYDELKLTVNSYDAVRLDRDVIVLQDEKLSGGKGTFIVRSHEDWQKALEGLRKLSLSTRVVISDAIQNPRERSIQACVTAEGIVTGPMQRQFVSHPLLANLDVIDGDKYCGAQIIAADTGTATHEEATRIAKLVGTKLAKEGYRGIFGIDFLLDADDVLYTLEVNPRITGVTPLLSAVYPDERGIPFYLLHILELGRFPYRIVDHSVTFDRNAALTVLHTQKNVPSEVVSMPRSGTYDVHEGKLRKVNDGISFVNLKQGQFILQEYIPPGMTVKPGGRVMTIVWNDILIDTKTDQWYNNKLDILTQIHDLIVYREI